MPAFDDSRDRQPLGGNVGATGASGNALAHPGAAYLKANPGKLNFASTRVGNVTYLGAELFLASHGLQAAHVPFNGIAPAATAVAGGHVHFLTDTVNTSLIVDGRMRALAEIKRWAAVIKDAGLKPE